MEQLFRSLESAATHASLFSETDCNKLIKLTEHLLCSLQARRATSLSIHSSKLAVLATEPQLRQVTDWITSHIDAFCVALTCRTMRNIIYAQFPPDNQDEEHRFFSSLRCNMATLSRIRWAVALGCPLSSVMFAEAAAQNQIDAMQWLRARNCPWDTRAFTWAARRGSMDALEYLYAQGAPWDLFTASFAGWSGHLAILTWLHARGAPIDADNLCSHAASAGHREILQWARANCPGFVFGARLCEEVARCKNEATARSMLEWLRQEGTPWDEETVHEAMAQGHIDLVKWLILQGAPFNDGMLSQLAASYSDTAMLEWLQSRHVQMGAQTWLGATFQSNYDACEWLLQNRVPWDARACEGAAANDDLDLLIWLRDAGAPWDERVTHEAIDHSGGQRTPDMNGPRPNIDMLAWAREQGCPMTPEWSLKLLDWLLARGWICEPKATRM